MTKAEKTKVAALRERLVEAQSELILQAARADALPSDNALRKIADIEVTLGAIEAMLQDS